MPGHKKWVRMIDSQVGNFTRSAVASDSGPCASVGQDVLDDGGSAVDAAVASLLCMGVYHPQRLVIWVIDFIETKGFYRGV